MSPIRYLNKIIVTLSSALLLLFIQSAFASQANTIDSLTRLSKTVTDTSLAKVLDQLAYELRKTDSTLALKNAKRSLELSTSLGFEKGIAQSHLAIALTYLNYKDYSKAKEEYLVTIPLFEALGKKDKIVLCLSGLGNCYYALGNLDKAVAVYLKKMQLGEETGDEEAVMGAANNLGNTYYSLKNNAMAMKYYQQALALAQKLHLTMSVGYAFDNIALVLDNREDFVQSQEYHLKALRIFRQLGDSEEVARAYFNIGSNYMAQDKYDQALDFLLRSLELRKDLKDERGTAFSYVQLGRVYFKQNDLSKAEDFLLEGYHRSKAMDLLVYERDASGFLYELYKKKGDPIKALLYHEKYSDIKDSLYNKESLEQVSDMQAKYESEKKENEINVLTKDNEISELKLNKSRTWVWVLSGGGILLLALFFFALNSNRLKKEANKKLEKQNKEISEQKKEITDSINYAKRIQQSILPPRSQLERLIPGSFVLYLPKDIVSGDFYWIESVVKEGRELVIVAAADCTGHGVPGAFVSMLGVNLLSQIVNEAKITDPGEILEQLHEKVLSSLNKDITLRGSKDGMDMSILVIDKNNKQVHFSGAVRPLFFLQKGELKEIKGSRYSIGGIKKKGEDPFVTTSVDLSAPSTFYMFSDGYADQFGEKEGKKFMVKNFRKLILSLADTPPSQQEKIFHDTFSQWKGKLEQVDDVLVMGIRV